MNRYFTTSRKADGYYHINDRQLQSETIARCVYREQAVLVAEALNQQHIRACNDRAVKETLL